MDICGAQIVPKRAVKYLGVLIDDKGIYGRHVEYTTKKADRAAAALIRLMPNISGPTSGKRATLNGMVESILLYGAPIWHTAMKIGRYKNMLERVQRKMLLRVASAYRTTSTVALQVVTGTIPIDLQVEERRQLYEMGNGANQEIRRTVRARMTDEWQRRWEGNETKAQWTKKLIKDIRPWLRCTHRATDYYTTQFLTGHGSFRTYTERIGKTHSNCIYCGENDTAAHTMFRATYEELEQDVREDNIVQLMVEDERKWQKITGMIKDIMKDKETEERRWQALNL